MTDDSAPRSGHAEMLRMATDIVAAYLGKNQLPTSQVPEVITTVFQSLSSLQRGAPEAPAEPLKPAVSIKRSITPDYIVCLEDGRKMKMLKRHLRAAYDMSPDAYRAKWGLPPDYPMIAPNYAMQRSEFAKKIGLGRKAGEKAPRRRRRKAD